MKPVAELRRVKLMEVCDRITVGHVGPMADRYTSHGVPFLRSQNIAPFRLDLEDIKYVPREFHEKLSKSALRPGDVAVVRTGYPGTACVIPSEFAELNCADLVVITPSSELNPYYLAAIFNSSWGRASVAGNLVGAAQQHFNVGAAKALEVGLPSRPVQDRIAGILCAYDDLIENGQRRIKILESMVRALYREWFVHFRFPGHENHPRVASPLGEIPEGWEVKKLGEISSYISRGISPRYDETGHSVVINQKCVRDQRLSLEPARRQSKAIPSEKQVVFGDVLINSTGVGTLGRVAQVYEHLGNCTVDTHVTIARPSHSIDVDFYGCCLLSRQETFERLGIGATGQTELGRVAISEIKLVAPPTEVQRRFGMAVKSMRLAAGALSKQIRNLRHTRDLLLARLLSGQIPLDELEAA
jgi:type I restriction enzyme S subunit